jgi:hypothetical protein
MINLKNVLEKKKKQQQQQQQQQEKISFGNEHTIVFLKARSNFGFVAVPPKSVIKSSSLSSQELSLSPGVFPASPPSFPRGLKTVSFALGDDEFGLLLIFALSRARGDVTGRNFPPGE